MTQEVANRVPPAPLVSVVTITCQHAPYIAQNVAGVLAQRTTFPVEHLVGEDGSTDGTRETCLRLAAGHADRIRLVLRDRKDVMHSMGRPTGLANVLDLCGRARGRYIAVCPGDYHWTDPGKLQLQVDLMERRPELSACFTNAWELRNGERTDHLRAWLNGRVPVGDVTLRDLIARNHIPAATFLFRRDLLYPSPPAFLTAPIGDWILVAHMAGKGPIGYIDRHTAVREVHAGGLISSKGRVHKLQVNLAWLHELRGMVPAELQTAVDARSVAVHKEAFQFCIDNGAPAEAAATWKGLCALPGHTAGPRERLRNHILFHHPRFARAIARLRS